MNLNFCITSRLLCFVLLILFQQYEGFAETGAKIPVFPKYTPEYTDDESSQLVGLFYDTFEQNIDLEYSNLMPRSQLILSAIHQEVAIPIIKIHFRKPVINVSFESGYSILINAP